MSSVELIVLKNHVYLFNRHSIARGDLKRFGASLQNRHLI